MSRPVLSGIVALGLLALTAPAQDKFDCDQAYNSLSQQLKRNRPGKLSPEQIARLNRWAQRVYDACQTGDVEDPKALFDRLEREGY